MLLVAALAIVAALNAATEDRPAIGIGAARKNAPDQPTLALKPVDDPKLRQAFEVLKNNGTDWSELMAKDAGAVAQKYSAPAVRDAIQTTLEALESRRFERDATLNVYGEQAIHAALLTGDSLHISILKKLAHFDDPKIRQAVLGHASAIFSVNPPVEVFKEAVLAAEEFLPTQPRDTSEFESLLEEFESSVERVASYGSRADRKDFLPPIIDRFLNRYSDSRIRSFYERRLYHVLNFRSRLVHGPNGVETVEEFRESDAPTAMTRKNEPAIPQSNRPTSVDHVADTTPSTGFLGLRPAAVVVAIAVAIGLIWHMLRRAWK